MSLFIDLKSQKFIKRFSFDKLADLNLKGTILIHPNNSLYQITCMQNTAIQNNYPQKNITLARLENSNNKFDFYFVFYSTELNPETQKYIFFYLLKGLFDCYSVPHSIPSEIQFCIHKNDFHVLKQSLNGFMTDLKIKKPLTEFEFYSISIHFQNLKDFFWKECYGTSDENNLYYYLIPAHLGGYHDPTFRYEKMGLIPQNQSHLDIDFHTLIKKRFRSSESHPSAKGIIQSGYVQIPIVLKNLSGTGLCLEYNFNSETDLRINDSIFIQIDLLNSNYFSLSGQVIWKKNKLIGIEYTPDSIKFLSLKKSSSENINFEYLNLLEKMKSDFGFVG